jgi:membrane-bound lytic murein transglycosylase A
VVVPFPSRAQIDGEAVLAKQGLELCYVDPIEAFFFHIQGSGRVQLPGGRSLHLTYAGQNGHPYYPIGKDLFEIIPKEEMSLQRIEAHLRSLPPNQRQELMNKNPSYVFFAAAPEGRGLTYQGTPVVAGRTIATDRGLFPKGALAVLQTQIPVFADAQATVPSQWTSHTRLVLDQDTGGAIRGAGRVDYFWGSGRQAAQAAGVMKSPGKLWYLVPRRP